MKSTSGIQLIELQLSQRKPAIRYMVFTASTQDEHMLQAFDAGVQGLVVKESEAGELVKAIEAVMGGATHYPADLKRALDRRQQQPALTVRETEVLPLPHGGRASGEYPAALWAGEQRGAVAVCHGELRGEVAGHRAQLCLAGQEQTALEEL